MKGDWITASSKAGCLLIVVVLLSLVVINNSSTYKTTSQPQSRLNLDKVYGLGDLNHNIYSINLEGVNYSIAKVGSTHSMLPTLPDNATIIIMDKFNASSLGVGDIITFKIGSEKVVHRIDKIGTDELGLFFKTKGDNNQYEDSWKVRPDEITGVVVGVLW